MNVFVLPIISYKGKLCFSFKLLTNNLISEKPKKSEQALSYKQRKERESERRRLKTAITRAEQESDRLDKLISEKAAQLSELTDYQEAMALSEEIESLRVEQEKALEQWEAASLALEEFGDD